MSGRIITVRHGRPNLSRDMKMSSDGFGDWWARYDASGLDPEEEPPPGLVEIAKHSKAVIASPLPRAIETATLLTKGTREIATDPLFVEAPLPPPPLPLVNLNPQQWGVVSRVFWVFGFAPGGVESHRSAWKRVDKIADRLALMAADGDVVLCAHGYLIWMIDYQLRRAGWRRTARDLGYNYWSWRVYEPSPPLVPARAPVAAE